MSEEPSLGLMVDDIRRQGRVLAEAVPRLRHEANGVAETVGKAHPRVYLVGCGDSLDAGIASRPTWEALTRAPVEALGAMTFSVSAVDTAQEGSLLIALSQSGRVSRVLEAVRAARHRGLRTVAITSSATSPLAAEPADATWVVSFEKLGPVPGTTSYLLGTLALYELACAMSRDDDGAVALRSELNRVPSMCDEAGALSWGIGASHAPMFDRGSPTLALGYGPVLASARHTIRKILETSQLIATWQETEEYAHDEYSLIDRRFRVLQWVAPDRGLTRSVEVARYLRRLGVHLAVIVPTSTADRFMSIADIVYQLPPMAPSISPIVSAVPGQVLAVVLAERLGGSLYGMGERVHAEDGDPQIYESAIVLPGRGSAASPPVVGSEVPRR